MTGLVLVIISAAVAVYFDIDLTPYLPILCKSVVP